MLRKVRVKAYLVPKSKVRLFIPQRYFKQEDGGLFSMNIQGSIFTFAKGGLTFKYSSSMLPISHVSIQTQVNSVGYLASTGQKNISKAQENKFLWHATLGQYNIVNTQQLMSAVGVDTEPVLCPKEPGVNTCSIPLCP